MGAEEGPQRRGGAEEGPQGRMGAEESPQSRRERRGREREQIIR